MAGTYRRSRLRRGRVLAALAVVLAACGGTAPAVATPSRSAPAASAAPSATTTPSLTPAPAPVPSASPAPAATAPASHAAAPPPRAGVQVTVPVLMYHYIRVNPVASDSLGFSLSVTPKDFAAQMALLHARGFHTVSLADVRHAFDSGAQLPPHPIVITFDDGYADFATAAVPALLRNGFTATSFVISGNVGRSGYMSAQQIDQVVRQGMTIGSHTVDHRDLTSLSSAACWWELTASRQRLRQLSGQPVDDFAYPYGSYSGAVAQQVARAGYADAVTVVSGTRLSSVGRYTLPRVRVSGGESLAGFGRSLGIA